MPNPEAPLIVQTDRTLLVDTSSPGYPEARDALVRFAELEKSPEHFHTYRITPLSVWNAAAAGMSAAAMEEVLRAHSRYEPPRNVVRFLHDTVERYGRVRLRREGERMFLESADETILTLAWNNRYVRQYLLAEPAAGRLEVDPALRGHVKQAMIRLGYPVEDLAGYVEGGRLDLAFREVRLSGSPLRIRPYQEEAVAVFHANGSLKGGSGVVVLPCGAGKTVVGIGAMCRTLRKTLVLTTSLTAVRQWRSELLDKTDLTPDMVGEYTGEVKDVRPVTITTYQILTYRRSRTEAFVHFDLFRASDWGLVIYDEVHLLPAPVFRVTAEIQALRRLGLTATLVREDGKEEDVFTLIGPKLYDVPWKVLERQGWIAAAECTEMRVGMDHDLRVRYSGSDRREAFRLASENPAKLPALRRLLARHAADRVLVIGQYLDQLQDYAREVGAPLITGRTPQKDRDRLYGAFRDGGLPLLFVSKVGNFAIDLPDANVLVQVSGTFGSRQEEAQRLGRVLRPKSDGSTARFYTLVSRDTLEQDPFAEKRQRFLTEQGYAYSILDLDRSTLEPAEDGARC
ncbi:MAG: helicase-associated domain-containing protein [Planctomycetaceae bacterium]|nr:helicase-associated domain-containing protein [Planctomycetota bacterium]NUN53078.1 helicase-associated domain-containing protein [Planctomycetaceae bacterium]